MLFIPDAIENPNYIDLGYATELKSITKIGTSSPAGVIVRNVVYEKCRKETHISVSDAVNEHDDDCPTRVSTLRVA